MSIKNLNKNHRNFESNIKDLIRYGLELVSKSTFHKTEGSSKFKKILLEALLLRTCAHWENFIEKELVILSYLDSTNFKKHMELPENTKLNLKLIRAILYADNYKDYHDIAQHKKYFSKLLVDKFNPFLNITTEQLNKINFSYTIRNYLSHYSDYSKKKLCKSYIDYYDYKIFQEPGNFLLKESGKYFENLLHNFILVSVRMRRYLGEKDGKTN